MSRLKVPIICICIGEGGSGGALGIAVGDRLAMLEFAYYSVISPEGCAAILWRDGSQAPDAAEALKLTSKDLLKLGLIDAIIPEPVGGAHRNVHDTVYNVESYIAQSLTALRRMTTAELLESRYRKWRSVGGDCSAHAERKRRALSLCRAGRHRGGALLPRRFDGTPNRGHIQVDHPTFIRVTLCAGNHLTRGTLGGTLGA